jgi:lysophospholipase L1-like esterase
MKEIKIYEIPNIDFVERIDDPYIGMIFYVADIDTYYSVKTLKEINGINMKGSKVVEYVIDEYLDFGSGGGGGTGLTPTQLSNIAKIPAIQSTVDALPNNYASKNHNHSEYASKNHNHSEYASSSHRHNASEIDNLPSGSGTGLTDEEKQNLAEIPTIKTKVEQLAFHAANAFQGKIANFLGDSQTEANGHKTKIYHDWVKEILGLSKVNNYGISGTTITKKNASDNTAMCVRYANMDSNADLICVMGGVNDRWFNCQLGNFGDTDATTFYGAMETLCDGLLTKYPGKTIIFITPTEQNNNNCNSANTTGYTPTDFANAMKIVCAKYSIPVFDANTCSGIYPLNQANASLYTTDKLHLNNKGHEVLGNKLSKFILNGANVVMINNDNGGGSTSDTYGNIVVSKSTTTINEGSTDTFTVVLDKAPTNSQTVNISSNNSDVTLSTNTLTFDSSNYSTPQTVTINVAEDSDTVNDNCTLTLSSNNVSSKTITITITDNDSASGEPDVPSENQFIGKTVSVTKNFDDGHNGGKFAHLTALLNVDADMRSNSTYNIVLRGSNVSNMVDASNNGGTLFSDNSGEVSNASFVAEIGEMATFTQTVTNGNLTITTTPRSGAISTNYVKVPIIISGSTPYSFQIDEIKVIVNDVERNILKLGSFFASDREAITIE